MSPKICLGLWCVDPQSGQVIEVSLKQKSTTKRAVGKHGFRVGALTLLVASGTFEFNSFEEMSYGAGNHLYRCIRALQDDSLEV